MAGHRLVAKCRPAGGGRRRFHRFGCGRFRRRRRLMSRLPAVIGPPGRLDRSRQLTLHLSHSLFDGYVSIGLGQLTRQRFNGRFDCRTGRSLVQSTEPFETTVACQRIT